MPYLLKILNASSKKKFFFFFFVACAVVPPPFAPPAARLVQRRQQPQHCLDLLVELVEALVLGRHLVVRAEDLRPLNLALERVEQLAQIAARLLLEALQVVRGRRRSVVLRGRAPHRGCRRRSAAICFLALGGRRVRREAALTEQRRRDEVGEARLVGTRHRARQSRRRHGNAVQIARLNAAAVCPRRQHTRSGQARHRRGSRETSACSRQTRASTRARAVRGRRARRGHTGHGARGHRESRLIRSGVGAPNWDTRRFCCLSCGPPRRRARARWREGGVVPRRVHRVAETVVGGVKCAGHLVRCLIAVFETNSLVVPNLPRDSG